jgi:hypothetical protein
MFHTAMKVLVSFNGGRTAWQTRQAPPPAGDVAAFAVTPGLLGAIAIAVVRPGLDHVRDPGHRWWRDAELAAVHEPGHGLPGDREPGFRKPRAAALDEGRGPDLVPVRF